MQERQSKITLAKNDKKLINPTNRVFKTQKNTKFNHRKISVSYSQLFMR